MSIFKEGMVFEAKGLENDLFVLIYLGSNRLGSWRPCSNSIPFPSIFPLTKNEIGEVWDISLEPQVCLTQLMAIKLNNIEIKKRLKSSRIKLKNLQKKPIKYNKEIRNTKKDIQLMERGILTKTY